MDCNGLSYSSHGVILVQFSSSQSTDIVNYDPFGYQLLAYQQNGCMVNILCDKDFHS